MAFPDSSYPALFQEANHASAAAKRSYFNLTRATLVLLVGGAALTAVSVESVSGRTTLAVLSALVLASSLVVNMCLKATKPEQVWYGGRAVAESVKSMSWRYMMGADPYFIGLASTEADNALTTALGSIAKERKHLAPSLGGNYFESPQISDAMRAIRASSFEERKTVYMHERIRNQRKWYGEQASRNRRAENKYFAFVLIFQFCALAASIMLVSNPHSTIRLTGLFTSLASALIAWVQVNQHKELAQSYCVAELDLGLVQEQAKYVKTDRDLSNFVGDAENAISREHTLWTARRDRP